MIRAAAWLIAAGLHVAVPFGGVLAYNLLDRELPPVQGRTCWGWAWIEQLNPLSLAQGATETEVDALFGVRSARTEKLQRDRCVRYEYSPRLSYTVLFRRGVAESMWLTEEGFVPHLCEAILDRRVKVAARRWYPSEATRASIGCDITLRGPSACAWE